LGNLIGRGYCLNKKYILLLGIIFSLVFVSTSVYAVDCWSYDGNESTCTANNCQWKPTLTNPWCQNPVGCCDQAGCWMYDGDQAGGGETTCEAGGMCTWSAYGGQCMKEQGCCFQPWCQDLSILYDQTKCLQLANQSMPCQWNATNVTPYCLDVGMNMFQTQDSCLAMGGIWNNATTTC
jgi:hypothetical protein